MAALAQHVGKGLQSEEEDSLCRDNDVSRFSGNELGHAAGVLPNMSAMARVLILMTDEVRRFLRKEPGHTAVVKD